MSKNKKFVLQAVVFCLIFALTFFPIQEIFARKSLETPWNMTPKISGFYNEPKDEFSVMYFGSSHAYACLIFALTFFPIQEIFARKSLETPWNMTPKISGFYNEPKDEFSVMYFGSSHAYASFSPLEIWKQTGIKSYVFATQMQPMWASVTYLKEALKTQKPELVILECNMLYEDKDYMDASVNHSFMDDIPLSANKVALAQQAAEKGERFPLVFNFVKYHSRWAALKAEDFSFRRRETRDPYKGFVILPPKVGGDRIDRFDLTGVDASDTLPLSAKNEQYLREFIELCQAEGIDLWLTKAPSNLSPENLQIMNAAAEIAAEYGVPFEDFNREEDYAAMGIDLWLTKAPSNLSPENLQIMNAAAEIAAEYGVPFEDFNREEDYAAIGITAEKNFFDQRHMDIVGATRFSDYFSGLLTARYPHLTTDPDDPAWAADYETYQAAVADAIANPVAGKTTTAAENR